MGKYDALFDDDEKPAAPAPTAGKYAALFDEEPAAEPEAPGILSRIGTGIVDTAKSVGRGISKGADLISPITNDRTEGVGIPGTPYNLHVPFSQLSKPEYRREVERGASRAIPGNPGEKIANAFSPDFAAAAPADEAANPGVSDLGALGMSAAFNPMANASIAAAKAAAKGAANKAVDRIAARSLDKIAEGGTEAARVSLGEVGPKAISMLKEKPSLAKGKTAADLEKNFSGEGERLGGEREKLFTDADEAAVDRAAAKAKALLEKRKAPEPKKVVTEAEREATRDRAKPVLEDLLRERSGLPAKDRTPAKTPSQLLRENVLDPNGDAVPMSVDEPGTVRVDREPMSKLVPRGTGGEDLAAGQAKRQSLPDDFSQLDKTQRIAKPDADIPITETEPVRRGAPMSLISKHVDEAIARLKNGTESERAVAKAMGKRRDKMVEHLGADGSLSASDLRRQISDFQKAYDSTASNAKNDSAKEMSKALHGALEEHVGDPEAYGKIKDLTDRMSVATRAQQLLEQRAGKEAAPGGGPGKRHGFFAGAARDIKHSHTTIGAAAKIAHRVASPVANVADRALAGGAADSAGKTAGVVARYLQLRRAGKDDEAEAFAAENGVGDLPKSVEVQTTKLSPAEETSFQRWKKTLPARLQYEGDYDLRGFYKKNPNWSPDDPEAHMTDEFKLPNHKTFSDESRYYDAKTKHLGGHWEGNVYVPNDPRFKERVDESP
jgi:hypothetical protein